MMLTMPPLPSPNPHHSPPSYPHANNTHRLNGYNGATRAKQKITLVGIMIHCGKRR